MHFLRRCDPCFAPSLYREWIVRPRPPMRLGPLGPPRKPSWPCLCQEPRPPSSLEYLGLRGEGSIPVPLPPPAGFGSPYFLGTMGSKSRRFCRCFCLGEFGGRLQLLSIGAGECIFLRNLCTSSEVRFRIRLPSVRVGPVHFESVSLVRPPIWETAGLKCDRRGKRRLVYLLRKR